MARVISIWLPFWKTHRIERKSDCIKLHEPLPLAVIAKAEGPERISPEWWSGEEKIPTARDYYRVEDEKGQRFWLYRERVNGEDEERRCSCMGCSHDAIAEPAYAELVAASNFSFLRGASNPEELAETASGLSYKALAICDRNTVAGVVRAHKPAKEKGLQYIPGCRLVLQEGLEIACLPTGRDAWGRLCHLLICGNRRAPKAECYLWLDDLIRQC